MCLHGANNALRSIPFNLVCNRTTFRKKALIPSQGQRVCLMTENVLAMYFMPNPFNLICNMTTFRKKCFHLSIQPQGPRVCVSTEYVIARCSIPFNLICNKSTFRKKKCFDPTPGAGVCVRTEHVPAMCSMLHSL